MRMTVTGQWPDYSVSIRESDSDEYPICVAVGSPDKDYRYSNMTPSQTRKLAYLLLAAAEDPGSIGGDSAAKNIVVYSLRNRDGETTYIGTTNDPDRRREQHAQDGKLRDGGDLKVESEHTSRREPESRESQMLEEFQALTGRLPTYNRTSDGRYRSRR